MVDVLGVVGKSDARSTVTAAYTTYVTTGKKRQISTAPCIVFAIVITPTAGTPIVAFGNSEPPAKDTVGDITVGAHTSTGAGGITHKNGEWFCPCGVYFPTALWAWLDGGTAGTANAGVVCVSYAPAG